MGRYLRSFLFAGFGFLDFRALRGQVGDQLEALRLSSGQLAERLTAAEVTKAHFRKKREGSKDLLMAFPGPGSEIRDGGEKGEGFGRGRIQELIDRPTPIAGLENMGLETSTLAGGAGDKNIG